VLLRWLSFTVVGKLKPETSLPGTPSPDTALRVSLSRVFLFNPKIPHYIFVRVESYFIIPIEDAIRREHIYKVSVSVALPLKGTYISLYQPSLSKILSHHGQLAKYIHSNSFMLDKCQLYCVSNGSMGYPFLAASETKTLNGKPSSGLCRKACLFYWWPLVICHQRCILVSSSSGSLL